MFVREEVHLEAGFAIARDGLAGLRRGGWLLNASRAAYGHGISGTARVGPPRSGWPGVSRLVNIEVGDMVTHEAAASLPLRWEATGPGSGLFPALDADISLGPDERSGTKL